MIRCHTLVISDLHLGAPICRTDKILAALDEVRFKNLIINGDLFDNDSPAKFNSGHWEIISRLSAIAERSDVYLVGGNHGRKLDALARKMDIRTCERRIFTLGEKKILCLHGDEFDMYMKKLPFISGLLSGAYYSIQRFSGKKQHFSIVLKRATKKFFGIARRQKRLALAHGRMHGADVVICSHTHIPHVSEDAGMLFLNSGSFCDQPSTFITIRKDGTAQLHEI